MPFPRSLVLASLMFSLAACGGGDPPPVDAAVDDAFVPPDAYVPPVDAYVPFAIADHPPGVVIQNRGGPILAHPQLVVITYADDPNRAALEAHARWIVGSSWLTAVGAEYGVGAGSILGVVERTDNAPDTLGLTDIENVLTSGIADGSLPRAADGSFDDVLYVIYFPEHTTINDPSFGQSCVAYGGYHYEATSGGLPFSYAVIPACPGFDPGLSPLETEEEAVAHELIEAATDALPVTAPAYELPQDSFAPSPWIFIGAELADLCALRVGPRTSYREGPYLASLMWSNAAAAAGDRDPCIPNDPSLPYYGVSVSPDHVVSVTPGSSTTFDVVAWSTGPVPAFDVYAQASGGTFQAVASLDVASMNNGDHATLTVSVPAGTTSGYSVIYVGVATSRTEYEVFPVVVYVP